LPQGEPSTIEQKRMGGSAGPFAGRNSPIIKDAWLAFFTAIGRLHAWPHQKQNQLSVISLGEASEVRRLKSVSGFRLSGT
jgi:hypothetical protein